MLGTVVNWLGGGVVTKLAGQYFDHLVKKADSTVERERVQAEKQLGAIKAAAETAQVGMQSRWFWFGWLLFVVPTGIWYAKVMLWDRVLGWGYTDPLGQGAAAQWAQMIVESMFLPGALVGGAGIVASMIRKR